MDWKTRAAQRKKAQLESIPPEWRVSPPSTLNVTRLPYECGVLSELEHEITDTLDVQVLLNKLRDGVWGCVDVTTAFVKRAIVAHQAVNCLTEIFTDRALARAKELDQYLQEHGKPIGPLHGLPISLKDQFTIKGLETINGYVTNIGEIATHDSVLVEILLELGAVLYVRTNVPQTLMWIETYNHVFGRTLNPYNLNHTSGGSSGGEGALVAMRGSILGVGTDIGGSIRVPSVLCGIYGLKPSYSRLPYCQARNTMEGQETITSVLGPMSASLSGLKVFTQAVVEAEPWLRDPLVLRVPWNEGAYRAGREGKKCFGIMFDVGLVKPHPPIQRALEMVRKALEDAGHQVIGWEKWDYEELYFIAKKLFYADGGEDFRRECAKSGEPVIQTMDPNRYSPESHEPVSNIVDDPDEIPKLSVYDLWQIQKRKQELRKEYLDFWRRSASRTRTGRPVDALICPAAPCAAPPHGKNTFAMYTTLWNLLDYTAGIVPVTFVDPELDKRVPAHEFYGDRDQDIYQLYDPEVFKGLPVGVQVVGQRLEEEGVLGIMEQVDGALSQYKAEHRLA